MTTSELPPAPCAKPLQQVTDDAQKQQPDTDHAPKTDEHALPLPREDAEGCRRQIRTSTLTLTESGYWLRSVDYPSRTLFVGFDGSICVDSQSDVPMPGGQEVSVSVLAVVGLFTLDLFTYMLVASDSRCRGTIAGKHVYEITSVAALPLDYAAGRLVLLAMLSGPDGLKHRKSSLALQPTSQSHQSQDKHVGSDAVSGQLQASASQISLDDAARGDPIKSSLGNNEHGAIQRDGFVQALQGASIGWLSPQIAKLLGRGQPESAVADPLDPGDELLAETTKDRADADPHNNSGGGSSSAQRMESRIIEELSRVFGSGGMFYSYDYDLTSSLQQKEGRSLVVDKVPISLIASTDYWFNHHLQRQLLAQNAHEWALPLIQGCIQIAICEISGGDSFQVCVVSRRNWRRIGMRYERRGADASGYTANSVDTEQILTVETGSNETHYLSFVQTRGSIPFCWKQPASGLHPAPVVLKSDSENVGVCAKHMQREIQRHGRQVLVNLVEHKGREATVGSKYASIVGQCVADEMVDARMIRYIPWDFHFETRGMRYENLQSLLRQLRREIDDMGYHWRAGEHTFTRQGGVFRVNCMDCLDRTNVVQSTIARSVLNEQLVRLGVHIAPEKGLAAYNGLESTLNHLWANNGDYISRQYAGTSAMKGDFTRTGKRNFGGVMSDASYSLARLWISTFRDYFSQAVLDYAMGYQSADDVFRTLVDLRSREPDHTLQLTRTREAAIEASIAIVVHDGEDVQMACIVQSSMALDSLKQRGPADAVLIVTTAAVYVCRYHYQMEKVSEALRIELSGLARVQYGAYITDTQVPQSLDPARNHGLVLCFDAAVARFNSGNAQNKSNIGPDESPQNSPKPSAKSLSALTITEPSDGNESDRSASAAASEHQPPKAPSKHFIACKLVSEAQVVMQRVSDKASASPSTGPCLMRLESLEKQSPDLLAECLCSVILSASLKTNTVDSSNFIVDAPIISAATAKQGLTVIDKNHAMASTDSDRKVPVEQSRERQPAVGDKGEYPNKLMEDPIMRDYVKKILGDDAEAPADFASLIIESRRRGREGLPQPHLRPHRCDKHLQDFLDGIFAGEFWQPAKIYFRCLGSKQGDEPERYRPNADKK
ncbi:hypothetical protein GGI15_003755 [Coemansia interrupta]|uniref:SAC domain-containing protein n=1 Tax=Coemansia interrupta TaxID=1126814 RepID=A0A9W8LI09_9FUNG|nr:hypothetical protein GGI15_003755 [Coemansia interrupta]